MISLRNFKEKKERKEERKKKERKEERKLFSFYVGLHSDSLRTNFFQIQYDDRDFQILDFDISLDDLGLHSRSQLYEKSRLKHTISPTVLNQYGGNLICFYNLLVAETYVEVIPLG